MAQRAKNKPELKIVVSNTPEPQVAEPVPEQVEMPFAIVNGEPVTQMPKDLYIPPQAMEVFLEAFEGPLDLLLYLIRRQNLNILDIPLAEITRQYMEYIDVMTELQLELAGEYMVMAATLAEIKSRMLLPRPKVDPDGNEEDPRAELVRRLQEYERFKRAAESIDAMPRLERDVWQTSAEVKDRKVVKLLPTVTLQEMLLAFKDVVVRSEMFAHHHIQRERLSVRERMGDVLTILEQASFVEFVRLFRIEEGRMGVTVTFMALLELVREGLIEIVQAEPFAPIHVRAAGAGRKLHVVGGNESLAQPADETAAVVAEAVVGGVPVVTELYLDPNFVDDDDDEEDAPLEGVDDVIDRSASSGAAAPTSLVDDVVVTAGESVSSGAAAPTSLVDEVAVTAGESPSSVVVAPMSVLDEFIASASEDGVVYPAVTTDIVGSAVDSVLIAERTEVLIPGAHFQESDLELPIHPRAGVAEETTSLGSTSALDEAAGAAEPDSSIDDVVANVLAPATTTSPDPLETAAFVDSLDAAGLPVAVPFGSELPPTTDVVAASVESVLVDVPDVAVHAEPWLDPAAGIIEPMIPEPPAATTVAPPLALDEAGAVVELASISPSSTPPASEAEFTQTELPTLPAGMFASTEEFTAPATEEVALGAREQISAPAAELVQVVASPSTDELTRATTDEVVMVAPESDHELSTAMPSEGSWAAVGLSAPADELATPQAEEHPTEAAAPTLIDEIDVVSELAAPVDETAISAVAMADDIAVTYDPSLTDVTAAVADPSQGADVGTTAEPVPTAEVVATVDPAVFDSPASTAESELSSDVPPGEELPPAVDVEYDVSAEDLAPPEEAATDDTVSLVGETSVTGDVSLVGDESVSGGPAVEVKEFAFDELPALDEAGQADQQPAAGAQTVVEKLAGMDEPPSPGEETDD